MSSMWALRERLSFANPEQFSTGKLPFEAEVVLREGCDLIRLPDLDQSSGDGESVWARAVTPGYRSIREHPVESRRPPGFPASHISARRAVVRPSYHVEKPIRLWSVPSPHEDD